MSPKKQPCKSASCSASLTVPELEQSKTTALNMLASAHSRRSYKHAIEKFIAWYCSEPRLGFNRSVVVRYRSFLEGLSLSAATINLHLSAIRRLADEAAESGWLSPELAIGIRRVKGVKRLGRRIGNWLTADEAQELLNAVPQSHSAWHAMAEHLRTKPGVNDIYAAVVEIGNIARRELGPSHLGNSRDLRIRVADRSTERTAVNGNLRKNSRCVALEPEDGARQILGKHGFRRCQQPLATLALGEQLNSIKNFCLGN